ncbi:hypothetical protein ACJ6WF_04275 [Streptomyces sp. MMS24-I2-30]|uniref:Rv1733c family protein n=1 Tax=Streptomyces sp. MMS24-I2-30 TaxID=3351564 RepID=UPI003896A6EF
MRILVRGRLRRGNPLRRRSDVVAAWSTLGVAVLLFAGAPLAGVWAGLWAHRQAATVAAVQRAERHHVRAKVTRNPSRPLPAADGQEDPRRATVRWTEAATGEHTAEARVPTGTRAGDVVDVWIDARGHGVGAPPGDAAVWQHTVTVGGCAAGGAALLVVLGHGAARRTAMRRRLLEWEREWARTGPDWTSGAA